MLVNRIRLPLLLFAVVLVTGCDRDPFALREVPVADDYCGAAQEVVTRTALPVQVVVHDDFDAFVKSKAVIDETEGPIIQQFNWFDTEGRLTGISCKLKSADHLNMVYGEGAAGPDGLCQDMNKAVFKLIAKKTTSPAFTRVSFDPAEVVSNDERPEMTGPDWLAPFSLTYEQDSALHIVAKGFTVEFTDPRYLEAPERFRGVHYCHLVAPDYMVALMAGRAPVGAIVGKEVEISGPAPHAK